MAISAEGRRKDLSCVLVLALGLGKLPVVLIFSEAMLIVNFV